MDELQRSIYVNRFRLAFLTQKGAAFQEWFVKLAGYAFGADFEEVRAYGRYGDLKCDGRRISTRTVFQCYAPDTIKEADLITKILEDLNGARPIGAITCRNGFSYIMTAVAFLRTPSNA